MTAAAAIPLYLTAERPACRGPDASTTPQDSALMSLLHNLFRIRDHTLQTWPDMHGCPARCIIRRHGMEGAKGGC